MEKAGMEIKLKAFDTVLEWSKQLVTIAAALLIFSATFIKEIVPDSENMTAQCWLVASWISLLFSIASGIFVMGSLAAYLNRHKLDIFSGGIRILGTCQIILFLAGVGSFLRFVICNMPNPS